MSDLLKDMLTGINTQIERAIMGEHYTTAAPQSPPLTYDRLLSLIPPAAPFGGAVEVREVPLTRVQVQAKRHKRKSSRRWQKKWLKRFGTVTEYRRIFKPGEMLADNKRGVVYAHPEEVRAMKAAFSVSDSFETSARQ